MTIRYYGKGRPAVDPYPERFMRRAVAGTTTHGYSGWRRNQDRAKRRFGDKTQRRSSIHESYGPPEKEPVTKLDTAAKGREPESNEGRRGNGVGGTF